MEVGKILKTADSLIEGMKDYFSKNSSRNMQFNYSEDNLEKSKQIEALDYLEEKGYIELSSEAIGFVSIKLTPYFIDNINNL